MKLLVDRTLAPSRIEGLRSYSLTKLPELVAALAGTDVLNCIQTHFKLDELPNLSDIYEKLLSCWLTEIEENIKLIQPSKEVVDLFDVFKSRYVINSLFYALQLDNLPEYPLLSDVAEAVQKSSSMKDLIRNLQKLEFRVPEFIYEVLRSHSSKSLREVDEFSLYEELTKRYWDALLDVVKHNRRSASCVKHLAAVDSALKALRAGSSIKDITSRFPPRLQAVITSAGNSLTAEELVDLSGIIVCDEALSLESVSISTFLRYLLLKDWETLFVSYLLNMIRMGFPDSHIQERLGEVVKYYESLTR
ncbi:MAG: hypothetical protein J7L55_00100 [Desulfurococcales archaeon]|nr:hypothetical protein [Desulfurococcales archaeon]